MNQIQTEHRQDWMGILATADWEDLKSVAAAIPDVTCNMLRAPETGLVTLRGRMGGTGSLFNVGEATVTRCSVQLENDVQGHAYVLGRNVEHARVAAVCDGLMQAVQHRDHLKATVIEPLRKKRDERRALAASKAAATKVDFFTLVRGDG
jgi:alpha-D-ribose 1-methylphosphonate 5-triphosphate synthase subunit PhnG